MPEQQGPRLFLDILGFIEFHDKLDGFTGAYNKWLNMVRTLVFLHKPERALDPDSTDPVCCVEDGEKWPCRTVKEIADQMGLETE